MHHILWRFSLCGNGKQYFNFILDPDSDLDHHQNLITSKMSQVLPSLKILAKSPCNPVTLSPYGVSCQFISDLPFL